MAQQPWGRGNTGTAQQAATASDAQEVARVAYELYEQRGRADGHDLEDWLQAEAQVRRQTRRR